MRRTIACLALVAATAACEAPPSHAPRASAPPPLILACDGPIGAGASRAQLAQEFGAGNLVDQSVAGLEGDTMQATVLYPNDPEKRLQIVWQDQMNKAVPGDAAVSGPHSAWTGPGGIKLGASLADVEAVNHSPFKLTGFGWDYGGFVSDWGAGALASAAGCVVNIRFDPADGADLEGISGEGQIGSDAPKVRAANPKVSRLSIGYPAKTP